jgi:diguanylate cyclase (GGDEF)-like protein
MSPFEAAGLPSDLLTIENDLDPLDDMPSPIRHDAGLACHPNVMSEDDGADSVPQGGMESPDHRSSSTHERVPLLSTGIAGRREVRFALAAIAISFGIFAAAVPFAKMPLGPVPAFTPIFVSTLVVCDVLTTILLLGQFRISRSRGMLVLACGYLFTASIAAAYAGMFPGLFSSRGLFGAGSQSTSAMYMFWHGGFPLVIIGYALLDHDRRASSGRPARKHAFPVILACMAGVIAIVAGYSVFVTAGHDYLPEFIRGDRTTDLGRFVLSSDWLLCILALACLWWRRPRKTIDLWLMVVCFAWLFDIALSAVLNTGRYDLGWYVGRIYGLVAATFLLAVLLIESINYYARLVSISETLVIANTELERLSHRDGLTGIANRRSFDDHLAGQIAIARRYKRNLAVVLFDVDSFKTFNDHYGHPAGDACLRQVAQALLSCCRRPADMAARYGGEEFVLILPDTELAGALKIAEAARRQVMRLEIPHDYSLATSHVSISGGVAVLFQTQDLTAAELIAAADLNLYRAKHMGRNRVMSAEAEFA